MNCKNFEATISDLAREQMLEAAMREGALLHIEECAECAALLEDERGLTRGLRALAARAESLEAPAHVEANLLAQFRERKAAAVVGAVVVQMPQRASRWQRLLPQAAAAGLLLTFALGGAIALRLRQGQAALSQPGAVASNSNSREMKATPVNAVAPSATESESESAPPVAAENPDSKFRPVRYTGREAAALRREINVPKRDLERAVKSPVDSEIATDFMPVSYGDNLNELDNGRIVRVEMPRSALAQFGLPVNMDRSNERVKADVLIGDDGMARAIRFVR